MHYTYMTKGICAVRIAFDLEDGVLHNVDFVGGCDGNHKGLAALVEGCEAKEIARRLKGITCGMRKSSCPDQLAVAIREVLAGKA